MSICSYGLKAFGVPEVSLKDVKHSLFENLLNMRSYKSPKAQLMEDPMRYYVDTLPTTRQRELEAAATKLLWECGYRGDGLRWGSVDQNQRRFEMRCMVKSPTGGQRVLRPR